MNEYAEINKAVNGIGTSFEAYKTASDEELKKVRAEIAELLERQELLEAHAGQPSRTGDRLQNPAYTKHFESWVRKRCNSPADEMAMNEISKKDITLASPAGGGYALPKEIARDVEEFELQLSPVRRLVRVLKVGTTDYHHLLSLRGATSGWVGESGARSATLTPQLRDIVPTFGELYAYPQISEWALDDMQFDAAKWLAENIADEMSYQEGVAVISGNGITKPTGMLNTPPTAGDDFASPLRAAASYQFITAANSPLAIDGDSLISLIFKLNSSYRSGASWVMNSATCGAISKLKDSNGQYLWQQGLHAGKPNLLLGYPMEILESMPDIGTGNFPVGFGNWQRAYLLTVRTDLRITRDDVTNVGYIRFYVRRREGGIVLNNDAAKFLKTV